jgi:hypothetical protein
VATAGIQQAYAELSVAAAAPPPLWAAASTVTAATSASAAETRYRHRANFAGGWERGQ